MCIKSQQLRYISVYLHSMKLYPMELPESPNKTKSKYTKPSGEFQGPIAETLHWLLVAGLGHKVLSLFSRDLANR